MNNQCVQHSLLACDERVGFDSCSLESRTILLNLRSVLLLVPQWMSHNFSHGYWTERHFNKNFKVNQIELSLHLVS